MTSSSSPPPPAPAPSAAVEVAVLVDPAVAAAALDPTRARLLAALGRGPASAAALALEVGLSRQRITYHLRTLAGKGLVEEVAQRRHGGLTERLYRASAGAYLVSPAALGPVGTLEPGAVAGADDRSASHLLAVAGRVVHEVGWLLRRAVSSEDGVGVGAGDRAAAGVPTLSLDAEIRLASPEARAAFAEDLAAAVRTLAARYHDESAADGHWYRLIALSHPRPPEES